MENIIPQEGNKQILEDLLGQHIAQMLADPQLTKQEKEELLKQLELPDDEWQLTELPAGAEPLSETVIKMRRGE